MIVEKRTKSQLFTIESHQFKLVNTDVLKMHFLYLSSPEHHSAQAGLAFQESLVAPDLPMLPYDQVHHVDQLDILDKIKPPVLKLF